MEKSSSSSSSVSLCFAGCATRGANTHAAVQGGVNRKTRLVLYLLEGGEKDSRSDAPTQLPIIRKSVGIIFAVGWEQRIHYTPVEIERVWCSTHHSRSTEDSTYTFRREGTTAVST